MRTLLLALLLVPQLLYAQDARQFARALERPGTDALDRWMKKELHRQRKGQLVNTPSASYIVYDPGYDSLVAFLRRQPRVLDAAWDGCMAKFDIWPGHSTIGLRWGNGDKVFERCYALQEGRTGAIHLFGWRPKVRRTSNDLKFLGGRECPGFVQEQRRWCAEQGR